MMRKPSGAGGKRAGRRQAGHRARLELEELPDRLAPSATNVLQYHNDSGNTGQNLNETSLTPTNVNSTSFGKLFSTTVDGQVYAQPLVLTGVNITTGSSQGTHDVVFVATEHDSLYAIDANTGTVLWHDALLPSRYGGTVTTVPSGDINSSDLTPEIGITATPVIDPTTNTVYVEEKTKEVTGGNSHYLHWLQALDVGSGAARFGGPVLIADSIGDTYVSGPTVNGTGANPGGAPSGKVAFDALRQMDRPGLVLANGSVYLSYASHGDNGPYHGWVLGYNATTLAPTAVFNTTPNGSNGGIWQSGTAIAVDPSGNLYFETGNGTFDTTMTSSGFPSSGDFGDSFVKLAVDTSSTASNQNGNLDGWGLKAVDYFTPFNQANLNNGDVDLGSGGPFLLPASAGSATHTNLLVGSGKEGRIYLIDTNNMGHFNSSTDNVVQELPAVTISGSFGTGSYFKGQIYYVGGSNIGNPDDVAKTFSIAGAQLSTSPTSRGTDTYAYPGNSGAISANGSTNGILWAVDKGTNELRAYNASNLATELYTSAQAASSRDALGSAIKFAVPTVANGHVYVGTSNAVVVYGLLTQATQAPGAPSNLTATAASGTVVNLTWQDNDTAPNSATGYDIEDSTNGTTFTQVATASAGATSFAVGGLQTNTAYTFRIRAFNTVGTSAYSNTASATTLSTTGGLNFSTGFAGSTSLLTYNGSAKINGTSAELTDNNMNEAGSVFSTSRQDITKFTNQFTFQLTAGTTTADGFTFTIEGVGNTALGSVGGGLGYGPDPSTGTGASIGSSAAVKFDLFNNSGEGVDSTGLFTNGAAPTTPAIDLTATGLDLHSGDVFNVQMTYDGATLQVTMTDTTTNKSASQSYSVNIPNLVGSGAGYVGFTGGTGGQTAAQSILTWTYAPATTTVPAAPSNLSATAATGTQINLAWTNNATNQTGFHIDRATSSDFTQNLVTQTAAAGATTFIDSGLTPGTTYFYRIRAFDSAGDSANSNTASATTLAIPAATTNFHPTLVTPNGVDLEWINNAANATSVKVFRALGTNSPVTVAVLSSQVNSFFDTGLTAGGQYTYSIQAFNNAGPSVMESFTVITPTSTAPGFSAHITFTSDATEAPTGYTADTGLAYGTHGSLTEGWLASGTPTDNSAQARDRDIAFSPDLLHDNLIHLQKPANPNAAWQIAVPNGTYEVHILSGDPTATDSVFSLNANGVNVVTATPNSLNLWADGTKIITVTNGLITVTSGSTASNNKIDAIDIIPVTPATQVLAVDAGGAAVGSFAADEDFSGGATRSTTATISTTGTANPAPAAVYQSQRYGSFSYVVPNLTAGASYTVRLHFAEFIQNGAGLRTFSVAINGTTVLSNFDVFATAGGFEKALTEAFTATADSSGKITLVFTPGNNNAILNGLEVLSNGVNFAGFAGAQALALNGSAAISGSALQLTNGGANEAGSAFTVTPVSVARFTTSFSFQLLNPSADGFTFTIQGASPTSVGGSGGGLGYAPDPGTGIGSAIGHSVAVKFDLFNNSGEGADSTGLYVNGAEPTTPATDLTGTGINLHSGDVFNVVITYDGTTLTVKITDATTGATATQSYTINIPQTIGSSLAYVGFTGGTGGQTATQDILNWTYTPL
jgi:hypothetical protein